MSLESEVQALQQVPIFKDIGAGRLKLLAFTSERVRFTPGQAMFERGDTSDAAYVILSGNADVLVNTATGSLKVAEFKKHDIVGEMGVLAEIPRSATVKATTELVALRIDRRVFLELLQHFPQLAIAVMRELAHRLERTTAHLAQITTNR